MEQGTFDKMRQHYRENYFMAYVASMSEDNSKVVIVKHSEMRLSDKKDNFAEYVAKHPKVVTIIDHDSTEILWVASESPMQIGDTFESIHEMWTVLSNQPRYFLVGSVRHDNYNGGRPVRD
jgi:hypothetical protein